MLTALSPVSCGAACPPLTNAARERASWRRVNVPRSNLSSKVSMVRLILTLTSQPLDLFQQPLNCSFLHCEICGNPHGVVGVADCGEYDAPLAVLVGPARY